MIELLGEWLPRGKVRFDSETFIYQRVSLSYVRLGSSKSESKLVALGNLHEI